MHTVAVTLFLTTVALYFTQQLPLAATLTLMGVTACASMAIAIIGSFRTQPAEEVVPESVEFEEIADDTSSEVSEVYELDTTPTPLLLRPTQ